MPQRDVFAFGKSGVNTFLFASVGTEVNGSSLTVLSTLARLGEDPWLQAANWARLSRTTAAAALAAAIGAMPLRTADLDAAPATASRLIELLFKSDLAQQQSPGAGLPALRIKGNPNVPTYLVVGLVVILALAAAFKATEATPTPPDRAPDAPSVSASHP